MIRRVRPFLRALLVAALLGSTSVVPAMAQLRLNLPNVEINIGNGGGGVFAQQGGCLGNAEITGLIASGQILPLRAALLAAGYPARTTVLNSQVCRTGRGIVYYLTILNRYGQEVELNLWAADGSPYIGG